MMKRRLKRNQNQLFLIAESDIICLGGRKNMKTSVEATGKNIEQAIENALFELKAPRDDVDIKILCEGGLFKKAKVVVSISEDAIEKYQKREKIKEEESKPATPVKEEKKAEKEEVKQVKKQVKEEAKQEKKEVKEEVKAEVKIEKQKNEDNKPSAVEFIKGLVKTLNKEAEVSEIEEEEVIRISVDGEELSELIGYRGETLFALSYLMTTICKRAKKRQVLDVCGYREKRAESLRSLANRMAAKVAKTGRYVKLEPMDASERRQIHLALQDNDKVTTMSKGTEPKRFIMIFPREYKD